MDGTYEKWKDIKNREINLIVTDEKRNEILKKIGYSIDKKGCLIDDKTGKKVTAEDGLEINVNDDKKIALIAGTHTFVRNIAGYSQHLAKKGALNIKEK